MASPFLVSTLVVAIAEIGDKTQLLSLLLAARYRRPVPIICGIFIATVVNHALAAWVGEWIRAQMAPDTLRWMLGLSLLAIAAWTLRPDRIEGEIREAGRYGLLALTVVVFFLAEIGDKTQVATVVLAAQYQALASVVVGTTLGMLIANAPVVLLGAALADRIPMRAVRLVAAALFAAMGGLALTGYSP